LARKLKTYVTSIGFFDQAVATTSMKAALAAWGADSNLFHQGFASETKDAAIVKATLARPGVVLKRPVGSNERFTDTAHVPRHLAGKRTKPVKATGNAARVDPQTARKAAVAFQKQQQRHERLNAKRRAIEKKRKRAVAKAQSALEKGEHRHLEIANKIEDARAALQRKSQAEDARWEQEKDKLKAALHRART
jgi:hypothetical protein